MEIFQRLEKEYKKEKRGFNDMLTREEIFLISPFYLLTPLINTSFLLFFLHKRSPYSLRLESEIYPELQKATPLFQGKGGVNPWFGVYNFFTNILHFYDNSF
ncbi:MAG: hypothetical protein B6D56_07065 [Candidatus Omnitrophica bacterium 4484_70.1]|nr:MAG: hypothetical protein B6D56_07065 [Candidatus Omnitrophica bacterium 4484_70.1]